MKIAVVAPSGRFSKEVPPLVQAEVAKGFAGKLTVDFHPQCFLEHGMLAGDDVARTAAFIEVANDPTYDAVWFARGGHGACRIVNDIMAKLNEHARSKTYMGFSDAGFLLAPLYKNKIGRVVHGPMPSSIKSFNSPAPIQRALQFFLDGKTGVEPSCGAMPSVAFCLSVLADLAATPNMPKLEGHVVMLEDLNEHLYAIDRALYGIMNAPRMKGAAGIRLGRIIKVPENDAPFPETAEQIVQRWCKQTGIPYLGTADIGHDADNKIVPFGTFS